MPAKKSPDNSEARRTNVLLEKLDTNFQIFGEKLEDVRGRLAAVEAELREVKEATDFQKLIATTLRNDVAALTTMGRKTTADIASIKDDLKTLKSDVKDLKDRLTAAEAKLPA